MAAEPARQREPATALVSATSAMGELHRVDATDGAMLTVLAVTLAAQLRTRRYVPWLYWLTVVLVSIVGTQITDFFTDKLGVSLYLSTAVFAIVLGIVFAVRWAQERTLAITAIDSRGESATTGGPSW